MNKNRRTKPIPVRLKGKIVTIDDIEYIIDFPLNVFILLEFLEGYNLVLSDSEKTTTQTWLESIDLMLKGKLDKTVILSKTLTNDHVIHFKKNFFNRYINNKLEADKTYTFYDFQELEKIEYSHLYSGLKVTIGSKEYACKSVSDPSFIFRKTIFLKHGSYEIKVLDYKDSGSSVLIKSHLKLDLSHKIFEGEWVDVMIHKENRKLSLRCIDFISREILLEVVGGDGTYGL